MFNPYTIIGAILAALTLLGVGFNTGREWAGNRYEAQRAQELQAHTEAMKRQMILANELSDRLAKAEGRITTKTIEVIKYVPQVTTGRPCLNAATVGLLQPGSNQGLRPPASELTPEGAAPASSDTDIAYWIADANQHYETCAVRLNALVDFTNMANPPE